MTATQQNDGSTAVAVLATFHLKDAADAAELEQLLSEQGELMQAGEGFQFSVLARSTDDPDTYVNLAWWQDSISYLTVVRSYAFASRAMSGIGRVADTRIDRLVALTPDGSLVPAPASVAGLLELSVSEAEDSTETDAAAFAAGRGAESVVGRSLTRPGGHTVLTWWTPDTEPPADAGPTYHVVSVVSPTTSIAA